MMLLGSLATVACSLAGTPLAPNTRIEISAGRADVTVRGVQGQTLLFITPEIDVSCSIVGNVLRLVVADSARALSLQIPATSPLSVRVLQGDVDVRNMVAAVSADAGNGNTRVGAVRGDVTAKSATGTVALEDIDGSIVAAAQHNDLRLTHTRGDVRVTNVTGMTYLDRVEAVNLTATTVTGGVQCTCSTEGAGTWELRADVGEIAVSVQHGAALVATLDAMPHVARWRISGVSVHQDDDRRVTVARGSNGTRILLSSFSGGVTLRERDQ